MAQLDKTFPTNDCSACILTPMMVEAYNHPNIATMTYAEVDDVEGYIGNFKVKVRRKQTYVDWNKCTGCGDCASKCPSKTPDEFNAGLSDRRAAFIMFPQAVPRLVFAFGMMWAWLVFPLPIYGTLWLLLIAYLTVFLPLGLRTISGVILQIDRSLEESAQVAPQTWGYRIRTITMPLLRPGLVAAWLLLFVASVRELGASILLMGPKAKVITPAIVESWFSTSTELTAAMALLQTLAVALALALLFAVARRALRPVGE